MRFFPFEKQRFAIDRKMSHSHDDLLEEERMEHFFMSLVTCHSVVPEFMEIAEHQKKQQSRQGMRRRSSLIRVMSLVFGEGNNTSSQEAPEGPTRMIVYRSPSPDEEALVSAARDYQYIFIRRKHQKLYILIKGMLKCFRVLLTNDFDSTRKRMSVLVKEVDLDVDRYEAEKWLYGTKELDSLRQDNFTISGEPIPLDPNKKTPAILYVKGADSTMVSKLAPPKRADGEARVAMHSYMHEFASRGLRTLVEEKFGEQNFRVLSQMRGEIWYYNPKIFKRSSQNQPKCTKNAVKI